MSKTDEVKRAIEMTRQEFGESHCLVNCAATYEGDILRNVTEVSGEDWNHIIDVKENSGFEPLAVYGEDLSSGFTGDSHFITFVARKVMRT